MRRVHIRNRSQPFKKPLVAEYCQSFLCKLRGLALHRALPEERGLLLVDAHKSRLGAAVHMLAMAFDLTIVWLDSNLNVVDLRLARRWRSFIVPRNPARFVLECAASRYEDFQLGDQLALEDAPLA